jgi:hypothetical protein
VAESEPECLHCEINKVMEAYIERQERGNLSELIGKIGESELSECTGRQCSAGADFFSHVSHAAFVASAESVSQCNQ